MMIPVQAAYRAQELNPGRLTSVFRSQLELCKVKQGETIAVISDLSTRREYIMSMFAAADDLGADVYEMCVNLIPGWTKVGIPTIGKCKGTVDALKAADLIVIFHSPLFSGWLKTVRAAGARVQMIIDSPDDLLELQAPPGLREAVLHADAQLAKTKQVRVTSEAGTDFSYSCGDYPVMSQYGFADLPGRFDHWGAGHVHTFPNEGSANGTVIIQPGDIIILPYCRYAVDQVKLMIKDGFITSIEGGLDAKLMRDWLEDAKSSEQFPLLHRPEHRGRRHAQHARPLRRPDARLHDRAGRQGDHRERSRGRREAQGGARPAQVASA
jgi:2,5-dihydroxypyridine 5,6-dioxygenase